MITNRFRRKTNPFVLPIIPMIGAAFLALNLSACSPGALFGNHADSGVEKLRGYRQVNTSCSQMDLSKSRLDTATARKLVSCLDSQGALGGLATLVKAMSDDEFGPFVQSLNRSFIDDPETLYKVEHTLNDLKARGELDGALAGVGGLLQEDELITRSVSIFRKSYAPQGQVDPLLLLAMQRLARELTQDHVADGIDLSLLVAQARSFSSLWGHLDSSRTLSPGVAEGLVAYARSSSNLGRQLIDRGLDGSLFQFVDAVVPDDASALLGQVPRWDSVLENSLADGGRIAGDLGQLFAGLSQPVPCMQDARALRYLPIDVIGELTALPSQQARAFIERDKLAQLYLAYPLCSFPAQVSSGYHSLVELAGTSAIEPLTDLLRSAYQISSGTSRPVAEYLVAALGDPGFQKLLPALSELQAREAWNDLLLLSTATRFPDRSKITYALKTLIDPLPGATSSSLFDVLVQGFARVEPADLESWLKSFRATDSGIAASLRGLRAVYYANDAHPLLDLLQSSLAGAPQDPALLQAALKASARPEFQGAVRELSKMASDARLKDLLTTTLSLFDRYAARGKSVIVALPPGASLPVVRFTARHEFSASDLTVWKSSDPLADFGACEKIDFSTPWNELGAPGFESQFQAVAACVGSDGKYAELSEALGLLESEKTQVEPGAPAPRTIHALLVDAYDTFQFTASEAQLLAGWALGAIQDGRVTRALQAVPILIQHSVIRPLVDLAAPWITDLNARAGLRRLGVYGATVLNRTDIQKVVAYVDDLFRAHPAQSPPSSHAAYDRERVLRWISNKECTTLPTEAVALEAAKNARYAQIVDEYENAVVNDGPLPTLDSKLRQSWATADLKAQLDPIFKKFADIPHNGPVLRALLHFAARFSQTPQAPALQPEYPPGYLEQWLRTRANTRHVISYLYPGQTVPRVRLINDLDALSLMLVAADLYDPLTGNLGLPLLAKVADAWGDVPFENRPALIQTKFPKSGPQPKTLVQVVADIKMTVTNNTDGGMLKFPGLPAIPPCTQVANPSDPADVQAVETSDPHAQPTDPNDHDSGDNGPANPPADPVADPAGFLTQSHIFNITETFSSLEDNAKNGGLSVIRDLFFDLYYTGPDSNHDADDDISNNLTVATYLVRAGLLRQIGRLIADTPQDDPTIHGFFEGLIDGAAAPETGPVAESLFIVQPNQDLLWGIVDQVIKLQAPGDIATAKNIGLYALAGIDSLGRARTGSSNELMSPLFGALLPILTQNSALLTKHANLVGDLLTWNDGADFLHALASDRSTTRINTADLVKDAVSDTQRGLDLMAMLKPLDASPQASQAWDDFRANWKSLDQLAEYRALHLSDIGRDALNFLEARSSDGSLLPTDQAALSRKLLLTVATLLSRGNMELVDQLLSLAQRQPDEFYKLLESISQLVENGEIPRLLDLIQTKLGPPAQSR